jgi:hypothetical protein
VQHGLDCGANESGRFDRSGPRCDSAGSGAFDRAHKLGTGPWGKGDANHASVQYGRRYWIAPPSELTPLGVGFTVRHPSPGAGPYDVALRVARRRLALDDSCLDATYVESAPLSSIAAGQRSCSFPLTPWRCRPGPTSPSTCVTH